MNPEPRTFQPGTGIDVWEIAAAFKETDENYIELQKNVPLVERNSTAVCAILLRVLYPDEIDARVMRNKDLTFEKVSKRFPFLAKKAAAE